MAVSIAIILLALSILCAAAVALASAAILSMTAPCRRIVGDPPPGLDAECVTIGCSTGQQLAGWFARGRRGQAAILLAHGIRSDRSRLGERMTFLHAAGYSVLAVDLRAHGESSGDRITFGGSEADDMVCAVAWLADAVPDGKLGAIGLSLGGAALLLASPRCTIDALVLEAVFPDIDRAISNRLRRVAGPVAWHALPLVLRLAERVTGLRRAGLRPIEALQHFRGAVLLLSGTADRATTVEETQTMFVAAQEPKSLWSIEGAAHVDLCVAGGAEYRHRILQFFGRHLAGATPCG